MPNPATGLMPEDQYDYDDHQDDGCGNCGGRGWVGNCWDGCCVDADEGCEVCLHPCDWCNNKKPYRPDEGIF